MAQGVGGTIGEQLDRGAALEIDDDGPVVVATPDRPIVDAHDPRGWGRCDHGVVNESEHRVGAADEAQRRHQPCGRLAAEREAHARQRFGQPWGTSRVGLGERWQPLGEGRATAVHLVAPETSDVQVQSHGYALARKIREGAPLAAVHRRGRMTAGRAVGLGGGAQLHEHRAGLGLHALELQILLRKRENGFGHSNNTRRARSAGADTSGRLRFTPNPGRFELAPALRLAQHGRAQRPVTKSAGEPK